MALAVAPPWLMDLLAEKACISTSYAEGDRAGLREGESSISTPYAKEEYKELTPDTPSSASGVNIHPALNPAFTSEVMAQRLVEIGGSVWPGVGKKFRCVIPTGHANEDEANSAAVFRVKKTEELKYHCFLGHQDKEVWKLPSVYAFVKTEDPTILARRGLGRGELKLWAARAMLEFGMVEPLGGDFRDALREPDGVSDKVMLVWRGFVLGLECQMIFDTSNIYTMVYSQKFVARWCDVAPLTAYRSIGNLVTLGFLRKVGKTGKEGDTRRADVYAVGDKAFRWGRGPESWYPGGEIKKRVRRRDPDKQKGAPDADWQKRFDQLMGGGKE